MADVEWHEIVEIVARLPAAEKTTEHRGLKARMVRVLHNYADFDNSPGSWLFIGLAWHQPQVECTFSTFNDELNALIAV
jgi:hypothetical protein